MLFSLFLPFLEKPLINQAEILHELFYHNGLLNMQDDVSGMHDDHVLLGINHVQFIHFGPQVYPKGSLVITSVVRVSVHPSVRL